MATRVSRAESKARTKDDLTAAARRVFLEQGYHAASLDAIADEAGYTKGAVYSNFRGKDELFLAVLETHYAQRTTIYEEIILRETDIEETFRAIARFMLEAYALEPAWWPLLSEFARYAQRNPAVGERLRIARERFMAAVARSIERVCERHGITFALPSVEIARGSGALLRGMSFEWLLDPASNRAAVFEELHVGLLRGLVVPAEEMSTP